MRTKAVYNVVSTKNSLLALPRASCTTSSKMTTSLHLSFLLCELGLKIASIHLGFWGGLLLFIYFIYYYLFLLFFLFFIYSFIHLFGFSQKQVKSI